MEEFAISFIEESRELLHQLEHDLLTLEKSPRNKEIINNVFRVMHTLKGSARMFGFENMEKLSHKFEGIFQNIRDGLIKVSSDIIDSTLKGKDLLLSILDKKNIKKEEKSLLESLKRFDIKNPDQKDQETTSDSSVEQKLEVKIYAILFIPDEQVFTRGLDPDKVIKEINQLNDCKIILHDGALNWKKQKKEKICQSTWEIYLRTSLNVTDLETIFLFYDPEEYKIYEITDKKEISDQMFPEFYKKFYRKTDSSLSDHIKSQITDLFGKSKEENMNSKDAVEESDSGNVSDEKVQKELNSTINVSSHKLDELMNLVSELVISTASLSAYAERSLDHQFSNAIENIQKLTKKFRNNALDLRLIPVGTLLNRFNRHVRDLAKELNKNVNLIIDGQDTEIDKTILKSIESPLLHIIRNAIDHGIENSEERIKKGKSKEGLLKITAFYSGANVVIQIQDDGAGINLQRVKECAIKKGYIQKDQQVTDQELINLIMEPGFTTNENISMVSGRGVGMDVVRKELNAVSGSLEIETEKDLGTYITMKLPTTLSIIDTLLIEVHKTSILIPLLEIEYCFKENQLEILKRDINYIQYKNELVPFISLRNKFKLPSRSDGDEEMVIIINKFDKKYALLVDKIIGEHQAVIKPLGELFLNQPYFSGGSIMVDGKLALILDTNYLFNQTVLN